MKPAEVDPAPRTSTARAQGRRDRLGWVDVRRLDSPLVAVAWMLGTAAGVLEVMARGSDIAAVPAVIALHVEVMAGLVVGFALLVRGATGTRTTDGPKGVVRGCTALATSFLASFALCVGRLATGATGPTVRWLVPLLLVPPIALAVDLARGPTTDRPHPDPGEVMRVGLVVASLGCVSATILPSPRPGLDVRTIEVTGLGALIAVVALGATVARVRPRPGPQVRLMCVAGSGLVIALMARTPPGLPQSAAASLALGLGAWVLVVPGEAISARRRWAALGVGWRDIACRALATTGRVRARGGDLLDVTARKVAPGALAPSRPLDQRTLVYAVVVLLASVASMLWRVGWAVRVGWQPTGNVPTVLARAWDVGTAATPLVGTPTSLGTAGGASHPGPLLFDFLAPFVRILGLRAGGLVGSVVLNLGCWMVGTWAAFRAGGRMVAIGAWTLGGVMIHIALLGVVWEPFNVTVVLLAIYATFLACWATTTGTWRAWWCAVGLGSLTTQAYLPHGLLVIGPIVWSGCVLAAVARNCPENPQRRRARLALRVGLALAAVAWVQPALDILLRSGGNLAALLAELEAPRPSVGISGVWRAAGWMYSMPPRWGRVTESLAAAGSADSFLGSPAVIGLGLATLLATLWWWTRRSVPMVDRQLCVLAALLLVGAALNVTQLPREGIRTYTVAWMVVASMSLLFSAVVAIGFHVSRWRSTRGGGAVGSRGRSTALVLGTVLVVTLGLRAPAGIADVKGAAYAIDPAVPDLLDQVRSDSGEGEVLVLGMNTQFQQVVADTIVSQLIVEGRDVRVEPGIGNYYGDDRMIGPAWSGPMLWVTNGTAAIDPQGRRIARAELPGWTRAGFDDVVAEVDAWARAHRPVRLRPSVGTSLPKYLGPWAGSATCGIVTQVEAGRYDVGRLPAGALAWLYADGLVAQPALPRDLQAEVEVAVGQAPIEVWAVAPMASGEPSSDRLLPDGSSCPE